MTRTKLHHHNHDCVTSDQRTRSAKANESKHIRAHNINKTAMMGMPRYPSSVGLDLDEGFGRQRRLIEVGFDCGTVRPATVVFEVLGAPTTHTGSSPREKTNEGGDDDGSSSRCFSEEFRRHNRGIVREVKLVLNPVVSAWRKLLRRKSGSPALKRADGCLS